MKLFRACKKRQGIKTTFEYYRFIYSPTEGRKSEESQRNKVIIFRSFQIKDSSKIAMETFCIRENTSDLKHLFLYIMLDLQSVKFLTSALTYFSSIFFFYTPWKQKTRSFLMFLRGIEREYWPEMAKLWWLLLLSANPTKWSNRLKQFVGNSCRRIV